jgi:hypothetical protein
MKKTKSEITQKFNIFAKIVQQWKGFAETIIHEILPTSKFLAIKSHNMLRIYETENSLHTYF